MSGKTAIHCGNVFESHLCVYTSVVSYEDLGGGTSSVPMRKYSSRQQSDQPALRRSSAACRTDHYAVHDSAGTFSRRRHYPGQARGNSGNGQHHADSNTCPYEQAGMDIESLWGRSAGAPTPPHACRQIGAQSGCSVLAKIAGQSAEATRQRALERPDETDQRHSHTDDE